MAWVDYKKAYNMVSHSWIITAMGMVGVAEVSKVLLSKI